MDRKSSARLMQSATALRPVWVGLLAGLLLSTFGCAFGEIRPGDPFDRKWTLEQAQHRYTTLLRWSQFEKAKKFVAMEDRDEFMDLAESLEDVRFTDYESGEVELDDDGELANATIKVTYTVYTPTIPFEFEIEETQVWSRDGLSNNWHVDSSFEGISAFASR